MVLTYKIGTMLFTLQIDSRWRKALIGHSTVTFLRVLTDDIQNATYGIKTGKFKKKEMPKYVVKTNN